MHRISKLTLKNFKFFYGEVTINFDRKNILLYGENGSGKSSIFWALYTFLQSVFKTDNLEIRKYFDPKHEENLINRYVDDTAESAIVLEMEDENKASSKREISLTTINTKSDNLILETTLGSDFIDHNVLSRIYAYYHKEEIDLFGFFYHQLLSAINFREEFIKPNETTGSKNAERWWKYIITGLSPKPKMHEQAYKDFILIVNKFNVEFEYYLRQIEQTTNEYLKNRFEEKFKIKFEYRRATYNDFKPGTKGRSWKVKSPQIILSVELISDLISNPSKKIIDSPQSFLNEAKLSALSLAMRLAILDEKFVEAYPKVLVLDDMLMSMDMSNREFVLNILFENYLTDYQILFFTHQRGLFEDARTFIESYHAEQSRKAGATTPEEIKNAWKEKWELFEMYETENDSKIPIPRIMIYETSVQKALKYFKRPIDYSACGNNLRAALEEFFKKFLPHNYRKSSKELGMLDALLKDARNYFLHVGFNTTTIDKLERHLKRSLNKASHHNPKADFYKKELQEIFHLLEILENLKNFPVLNTNDLIKFKVVSQAGNVYEYTAQLLDDIRLYQESETANSFFLDDDRRGYGLISYSENGIVKNITGRKLDKTLDELYAFTVKALRINAKEDPIVEADIYKVFTDEHGNNIESLKKY